MSWKGDLAILGILGAGAYLVITNAGKISSWLGDQIGKGLVQPAQEAIQEGVIAPVYNAGVAAGTWTRETVIEPVYNAGLTTGSAVREANEIVEAVVPYEAEVAGKAAFPAALGAAFGPLGPLVTGLANLFMPPSTPRSTEISQDPIAQWKAGTMSMQDLASILSLSHSPPPLATPSPTISTPEPEIWAIKSATTGIPILSGPKEVIQELHPGQPGFYAPYYQTYGSLDPRIAGSYTDEQLRALNTPDIGYVPHGFSRSEHYTTATWNQINQALLSRLSID